MRMTERRHHYARLALIAVGALLLALALFSMAPWLAYMVLAAICFGAAWYMTTPGGRPAAAERADVPSAPPLTSAPPVAPNITAARAGPTLPAVSVGVQPATGAEAAAGSDAAAGSEAAASAESTAGTEAATGSEAAAGAGVAPETAVDVPAAPDSARTVTVSAPPPAPKPPTPPPLVLNVTTYQEGQVINRRQVPVRLSVR
jgi:hypothetical protein